MSFNKAQFKSQLTSLLPFVGKDVAKLGGMVLVCLLLLFVIYQSNKAQINASETAYFTQQLEKVIDDIDYDNALLDSKVGFDNFTAYYACQHGKVKRYIAEISTNKGYNGNITLLLAISDNAITDSEVVFHRETPGLGDLIERNKSDWLANFQRPLTALQANPNQLKLSQYGGQIDSLAGATITSNAISQRLQQFISAEVTPLMQAATCQQRGNTDAN